MIGENIAFFRKKNNLSQIELSRFIGVTRACVSQWELNKRTPNIYECKKIASVLNVSILDIIGNEFDIRQNQPKYTKQQKNCINMLMQLDSNQLDRIEAYLTAQVDAKEENIKERREWENV